MTRFAFMLALTALCGCSHAGTYLVEAAAEPQGKAQGSGERIFVASFPDLRSTKDLYSGHSTWEKVYVESAGRTTLAQAWSGLPTGDVSYLWHRQLAFALDGQGFRIAAAPVPLAADLVLEEAKKGESALILEGEIKKLYVDKHGADFFLGTNFSGTNYNFKSLAKVRLKEVATGKVRLSKDMVYEHTFYKNEILGSEDRDTFPAYFATGLINATRAFGEDPDLRKAAGVPTCTMTPTSTVTPEMKQLTPGVRPVLTATPEPAGPYWVNPNNGRRMDPNWKFDPEDGTPRSKFVLHNPPK